MRLRRIGVLSTSAALTASLLGFTPTPVHAEGVNQVSAHIDWSGIALGPNVGFSQSLTPHNVPPLSAGQVDWSLNFGNSPSGLSIHFTLSNAGRAMFAFYDVPAGSKTQNVDNAMCNLQAGNSFGTPNSWRSICSVALIPVAGEKYTFSVKPLQINGSQWYAGFISIQSTGQVIQLGRLEHNASSSVLNQSQYMTGFDQITLWKEPLPPCSAIPDFSVTFGDIISSGSNSPSITGTRTSQSCPGLSGVDIFKKGSYRVNIGNLVTSNQSTSFNGLSGAASGSFLAANVRPSTGGSPLNQNCKPGSVVTEIRVTPQSRNPYLEGFRFGCAPLGKNGLLGSTSEIREIVNQGVQESQYQLFKCGAGQAVTSVNAATANFVRDLSVTCSSTNPFVVGATNTFGVGASIPINAFSSCTNSNSNPSFVTGISAYAAAGLDAIQAICTPFAFLTSGNNTEDAVQKPDMPTFSLVNFVGNKININVNLGNMNNLPDQVYLVAPKIGITEAKRVFGKISGSMATWSLDFDTLFSGDLVPLKIVSIKNGVESNSLEENFNVPNLSNVQLNNAVPWAPKNVTSRIIGTSAIVTAIATLKAGALVKNAYLYSPSLGYPMSKAIKGEVIATKVIFEIPIKSAMAGKTLPYTVYFENEAGKSPPATSKISVPGIPNISSGGIKMPDAKAVPNTVFCTKGTISRTFAAKTCPPGWKKQ